MLGSEAMTKDAVGAALAAALLPIVPADKRDLWNASDGFGSNRYGETLARFALGPVSLEGLLCIVSQSGRAATLARTDLWLGHTLGGSDVPRARADLVRRYLHCYGPSTPDDLAAWAGIAPQQAWRTWTLGDRERTEVRLDGRPAWILTEDLDPLRAPQTVEGVRLLPPHDPYLLLRDHDTLVPDRAMQRLLWPSLGNPGVVLIDGRLAAAWRPRKLGRRLTVRVSPLALISKGQRAAVEAEADTLGPWRGAETVDVAWEERPG